MTDRKRNRSGCAVPLLGIDAPILPAGMKYWYPEMIEEEWAEEKLETWPVYSFVHNTDEVHRRDKNWVPPSYVLLDEQAMYVVLKLSRRTQNQTRERSKRWPANFQQGTGDIIEGRVVVGVPPRVVPFCGIQNPYGRTTFRTKHLYFPVYERQG
jgi:hypothetical protein